MLYLPGENMIHTKKPCGHCSSPPHAVDATRKIVLLIDGNKEEVYEERCSFCGNLRYGYSKRLGI